MSRCCENRFCSSLGPDLRARLCSVCMKSTYSANTSIAMEFYKHFLVVEGLCLSRFKKTAVLYRPGDFVLTPHADESRPINLAEVSFNGQDPYRAHLEFLSPCTLAYFDKAKIDELLKDPAFMQASYRNLADLYSHLIGFRVMLDSSSAYDSVRFVLKYCKHHGIDHLTHEQIAKICGHSRPTVSTIMHRVAQENPELL